RRERRRLAAGARGLRALPCRRGAAWRRARRARRSRRVALAGVALRPARGGPVSPEARAQLSLWDGVSVVVGIVVGVSLFKVPASVFGNVNGPWAGLGVWALGGLLSFVGALCYAELAAAWPESGGDYIYLSRAYGSWLGFLFGWAQLVAIL